MLNIITNNQYRELLDSHDVPKKVLKDNFDHLEECDHGFFKYRGNWYHISDFLRVNHDQFTDYDGYLSDSFFSGVLVKFSDCGDAVKIARFYS